VTEAAGGVTETATGAPVTVTLAKMSKVPPRFLAPILAISQSPPSSHLVFVPTPVVGAHGQSKHNGVDPMAIIDLYGADTARVFMLFKVPPPLHSPASHS
jgi:hypothetical protein